MGTLCWKQGLGPHGAAGATDNRVDKTIRKYASFDEMKADEYRYWQSRPVHERMDAVSELTQALYAMKGAAPGVPRLQRTVVHFQHPQR
jgi:hypothetical protein